MTKNQWIAVAIALLVIGTLLVVPKFIGNNVKKSAKKIDDGGISVNNINKTKQMNSQVSIEDIVIGTGKEAVVGKVVSVHYAGTLLDGKIFDSSYGKQPLTFVIGEGGIIPGFVQGVIGMKVGGVRKITIPPELAYGNMEQGPIPANSTLIFELKLEKVVNK